MGRIYKYKCTGCGNRYSVQAGTGMRYEALQEELLEKIRDGQYGGEWKELTHDRAFSGVDAAYTVYICPDCGKWRNEISCALILGGEWKELRRICGCGAQMERDYPHILSCPACGMENEYEEEYVWD